MHEPGVARILAVVAAQDSAISVTEYPLSVAMPASTLERIRVARLPRDQERVLTGAALDFVAMLHGRFGHRRLELLRRRDERQAELDLGDVPAFLPETREIRESVWHVADPPPDLVDRRVEITGPVERKMIINALNSGANVFMADFEDALSPTWDNVVTGQANLQDAVRGTISVVTRDRAYRLADRTATLLVRPRGWHLVEKHVEVDGEAVSASLFDFGLYFFHNARELLARGTGPYFYLPKLESHLEARLWNDVFCAAQEALGIPRGTIRATVLIETVLAAFEMEEILYELREHSAGLNAGRWDYIFSIIKKFHAHRAFLLPDRAAVTMGVPFMSAYAESLVRACHKREAHAIGGMAAFVPNRRDAAVTRRALERVREDKEREAAIGFDGTWVAHPDLVPVARAAFDRALGARPNQIDRKWDDVQCHPGALLDTQIEGARITRQGVATNVSVALQYLAAWLGGAGAVAIQNLMEDVATAEISRAQLWQWLKHEAELSDGGRMTGDVYWRCRDDELSRLLDEPGADSRRLHRAAGLLDQLVLSHEFIPFSTLPGYRLL
jgi:malate synthase